MAHTLLLPTTPTDSMFAGVAVYHPLTDPLCAHRHMQAEIYYITEGEGIMTIDGEERKVGKGDAVLFGGLRSIG